MDNSSKSNDTISRKELMALCPSEKFMKKLNKDNKQFKVILIFSMIILVAIFLFGFNEYSKNKSASVSFSGIENTKNQEIVINSEKSISCTYNNDESTSLRNGDDLVVTCSSKIFPFIKLEKQIVVEGLLETETTNTNELINFVKNNVAPSLPNIDANTLSQILYYSDPIEGMKIIPMFIVDEQSFNYYFIEKTFLKNDEFVTYHEDKIKNGMTIFSTATNANLKDYDMIIQLYRDLGYTLLM